MSEIYVKNAVRIKRLVVMCLLAWVSVSAVAASQTHKDASSKGVSYHYTEGADLRVEMRAGASEGKVVISNRAECGKSSCPPLTLQVGADVEVEDYRGKTPESATLQQLREWGRFYGQVAYVKEVSGQLRASKIIRTQRPVGH